MATLMMDERGKWMKRGKMDEKGENERMGKQKNGKMKEQEKE